MKRVFKVLLVLIVAMMPFMAVSAKTKTTTTTADKSKTPINFYVFYGNGCQHCEDLLNYIAELDKDSDYNYMYKLVKYETWYNSENATLMQKVFNYFGVTETSQMGVPLYVIGDYQSSGFPNPDSNPDAYAASIAAIKDAIKKAYNNADYKDIVAGIGEGKIDVSDADKTEDSKKTNDIIGYVIIGIVVIVIVAIIFGRSKSDTYYPVEDEDEEVEDKAEEEVKPVATKVAVKKPAAKKTTAAKTTAKKTTKTTSAKKTTTKKNTKKK